jgi:hypothetical protein
MATHAFSEKKKRVCFFSVDVVPPAPLWARFRLISRRGRSGKNSFTEPIFNLLTLDIMGQLDCSHQQSSTTSTKKMNQGLTTERRQL